MNPRDDPGYKGATIDLDKPLKEPSYSTVAKWIESKPDIGPMAFDFWARGNFTRRLLFNRARDVHPLVVRVSSVEELRKAYRRLSLLGTPADFVYSGQDILSGGAAGSFPVDMTIDAGWGYAAFPTKGPEPPHKLTVPDGLKASYIIEGADGSQNYVTVVGWGSFLPKPVTDWLFSEGRTAFLRGDLIVAPATAVGLPAIGVNERYSQLAGVVGGVPLIDRQGGAAMALSLDLPSLDELTTEEYEAFLANHRSEVRDFRSAFSQLTSSLRADEGIDVAVRELRDAVEEMRSTVRQNRARLAMSGAGSALSVSTFTISLLQGLGPATSAASGTAAALALGDFYLQLRERDRNSVSHKYALLWKLGLKSPSRVRTPPLQAKLSKARPSAGCHWLCPPTVGMRVVVPAEG